MTTSCTTTVASQVSDLLEIELERLDTKSYFSSSSFLGQNLNLNMSVF
jgi:hypothetical protein